MFRLMRFQFVNQACRLIVTPTTPISSSKSPDSSSLGRLPRLLQPKLLLGATILTGYYLVYTWYFDNEKQPSHYPRDFSAVVHRRLPTNRLSHFIGAVGDIEIPSFLRSFVFGTFVKFANCNMAEAKESDLSKYTTLSQLFTRELAPGTRPLDKAAVVNSPCDGMVLYLGSVDRGTRILEQVKGVTYSMDEFLGPLADDDTLQGNTGSRQLYQCVIYLAPGDYHHFQSPTYWTVRFRRHFTGKLLTLRPSVVKKLPGLFTLNERVVYLGEWAHGFMSLTAVGAVGVGSIVSAPYLDPALSTNLRHLPSSEAQEPGLHYHEVVLGSVKATPGAPFGHFKLGSSIVLIFEAPQSGFEWTVKPGERIKCGEALMRPEKKNE
ncbi:Phosphatidylserine decarboxylase proenzyme mitochondrial [Taenia crassiceps]|uniref:phosphatidylserine decarboxylase n=1 Tax=Taenia crassiceps TaxID=6207 RepID=A0ABR4QTY2_9CEST